MEFPPHSSAAFAATVPPPPATYSAAPLFPSSPTSAATNPATSGQQPSAANLFSTPLFAAGPSASYTAAAYSGLDAVSPGSTSRTPLRFPPGFLAPQPPPPLFPATSPPPSFGFHQLSASNLSNLNNSGWRNQGRNNRNRCGNNNNRGGNNARGNNGGNGGNNNNRGSGGNNNNNNGNRRRSNGISKFSNLSSYSMPCVDYIANNLLSAESNSSNSNNVTSTPTSDTCGLCWFSGHQAAYCPQRFNHSFVPSSSESVTRALAALSVGGEANDSVWYPDSGAASHMTPQDGNQ
ncbi:uncharacterized protein LOC125497982 isoform X2 [Beta vulgaris subsp. vulgaris]|uniref:uncharacterized protein LOC125497982 isoform X2 n=1 Tax=Beta vulgaris subsp. vulgaris TaxID=3555 RepID=UPI002036BEC4|nr:uncharacterized protein LOC125497982 isoform X2 [Beta vulgaris subsp. vulgaris]